MGSRPRRLPAPIRADLYQTVLDGGAAAAPDVAEESLPRRHRARWSAQERDVLLEGVQGGLSLATLAARHERTVTGLQTYLSRLEAAGVRTRPNRRRRWEGEEIRRAAALLQTDASWATIATILDRSVPAVRHRAHALRSGGRVSSPRRAGGQPAQLPLLSRRILFHRLVDGGSDAEIGAPLGLAAGVVAATLAELRRRGVTAARP